MPILVQGAQELERTQVQYRVEQILLQKKIPADFHRSAPLLLTVIAHSLVCAKARPNEGGEVISVDLQEAAQEMAIKAYRAVFNDYLDNDHVRAPKAEFAFGYVEGKLTVTGLVNVDDFVGLRKVAA